MLGLRAEIARVGVSSKAGRETVAKDKKMHSTLLRAGLAALAGMLLMAPSQQARADTLSDNVQVCAACHGESGVPTDKTIPNIWGQKRGYILNQLHDFKTGRRKNEIMAGIVASLSWTDMQDLSTYFAHKEWPDLKQQAASAEQVRSAMDVVYDVNCMVCHQENYEGDTVRPRLAGQSQEYLLKTMQDFRSGDRGNYIGMSALLRSAGDEQLKAVADYLGTFKSVTAQK